MSKHLSFSLISASLLFASLTAACGEKTPDNENPGGGITPEATLSVTIWGEDFLAQGIPAELVADGWRVDFDRFLVALEGVKVDHTVGAGEESESLSSSPLLNPLVIDLAGMTSPATIATISTNEGSVETLSFRIAPVGEHHRPFGSVTEATVEHLHDEGLSGIVEGTLSKDATSVSFAFQFFGAQNYNNCQVASVLNGDGAVEITLHADHLFMDSLVSEEPAIRAEILASNAIEGHIDNAIASSVSLSTEEHYQTGDLAIENLYAYLAQQFRRIGHVNGEGHCN